MSFISIVVGNNVSRQTKVVDSASTLRSVLEEAGIDYARGGVHLDGTPVQAGGLDKSFDDYGITERAYLLSVVKADNAAKIAVVGNAAVITSTLKREDIDLVQKYRPNALALMGGEENKKEIFRIVTTSNPYGNISAAGMMFGAENANGEAIITELVSPASDDIKSELADKYGTALVNLGKLEEVLPAVVEEIKAERAALIASIEVQ